MSAKDWFNKINNGSEIKSSSNDSNDEDPHDQTHQKNNSEIALRNILVK